MPIYEYKCVECGNRLEAMQKISDEPLATCPNCNGKLEKQWSRTGSQFKGTGWYVTDYAGRGAESASEDKTEGATKSSGGKTESASGGETTKSSGETSSAKESTAKSDAASKTETKTTSAD